ncbi:DUF6288 domain-containing protein (plasmid) [Verrucomicrobiaceae bacterium 227]
MKFISAILVIFPLLACQLFAAPDPPILKEDLNFLAGDKLPEKRSHDWTLGPTGARGWVQPGGDNASGDTKRSRQIYVTGVNQDSPAEGKLKRGDVIYGIAGKPFESDARVAFAKAISQVEAADGTLRLMRFRAGKKSEVTIALKPRPAWSATAPFDCERSAEILKEGCEALARRGLGQPEITSHLNALALLASGDERYAQILKDHARSTVSQPMSNQISLACWHFAFANIFLTEYYLITGDTSVLPEISRLSQNLVDGQGPLGTWGHTFMDADNGRLRGYGAVNAVGLPVAISLVLARECNAEVKGLDEAISLSASFFRRHVGLGSIPYGDGPPDTRYGHDDNGKSSAAALFFSLLDDEAATRFYTRCAIAAYGLDREQGHTGNFFNMLWSLPAVGLAGKDATGAWMGEFSWYYDLARDPEFRFPYQGYPRQRSHSHHADWNCPGAYLLHFAVPERKLRLTGRGVKPVNLSAEDLAETIAAHTLDFSNSKPADLVACLSSWSPIVRKESAAEMRRRGLEGKVEGDFRSTNPLERVAAIEASDDFDDCAKLLGDPALVVQIAAIRRIGALDKKKGFGAIMSHIAKDGMPNPVMTQAFADGYFPISARAKAVGDLLNVSKNRKAMLTAIRILLADEDALVASRIAMGLQYLPEKELKPLLPILVEGATKFPVGNVMFANKLQVSCAEVLTHLRAAEGLEASTQLLTSDAWGRNARLPSAAKALLQYQGHAKVSLPALRKCVKESYSKDSQWKTLMLNTIAQIEKFPAPKGKLRSVKDM